MKVLFTIKALKTIKVTEEGRHKTAMEDRELRNILILLPVVLLVAFASKRLYDEYRPQLEDEDAAIQREVIGELVNTENSVKRQFQSDMLWNNIDNRTPVYNKDSIRTGKDSGAIIKLGDNSIIEVGENSLIVLDKSQSTLNVNFKAGDITTKSTNSALNIQMKESTVQGKGAELKFKSGPGGTASVAVSKGKAYLTDKTRNTREIGPSELAGLSESGTAEIRKLEIHLKSPEHRSKVLLPNQDITQPFTWEVVGTTIKEEQFELSTTSDFKKGTVQILKGHQAVSMKLKQGSYYWRVGWPSQGKILYTDYRQFVITPDKRLELLEPENEVSLELDPQDDKVDFRWKSQIQAKVFVLDVASGPDFKQIVSNKPVSTPYDTLKNLPSGHYYWRVKAFGEKNEELTVSRVNRFTVKLTLPKIPEIIKPAFNIMWPSSEPVEFSWKKDTKATDYKVVISRTDDLKDVVKQVTTQGDLYNWRWETQGTYFWTVRAFGKDNTIVGQSEIRSISIKVKDKGPAIELTYPKDTVEITRPMVENTDPILFQWQVLRPLPGPATLLVSDTPDFAKPQRIDNLKTKSFALALKKPGDYYWKVVSRNPASNKEEFSDVNTFKFKKINSLAPPIIITPEDKSKVDFTTNAPIKFEWQPVEKASQYHIVVSRIGSNEASKTAVMDQVVKENTISSSPLPKGQYRWTISSLDEEGQEGLESSIYTFDLVEPELIDAPVLNAPVVK